MFDSVNRLRRASAPQAGGISATGQYAIELTMAPQLVEPENPFEEVRLSGLSIIREKLSDPDNQVRPLSVMSI